MQAQTKVIESLIDRLNDAWLNDKTENLDMFFHRQVVLVQPGSSKKITGREQVVESYLEFIEEADVSDFKITNMSIDVFGTTAVAYYTFRIHYRVDTTNFDESGTEILVLHRHNEHWEIIWRTQLPAPDY